MIANLIKVSLIAGAVLLSACSSVGTGYRNPDDSQSSNGFGPGPTRNPGTLSFHGSALGNSFGEYSSGLLHDD